MTILKWNAVFITQVLVEWLMDQVPLGNKTPRPGLPRLVHCPACRGLLPYPQALDSGHVLLECFAIEGTNPELVSVFLKTIQVQEFEKESEPSLRTAEDWARAKRQPTPSLSRDWIQVEPRCQFETTWREEPHFLRWPTCGFILGARKRMSEFDVIPFFVWHPSILFPKSRSKNEATNCFQTTTPTGDKRRELSGQGWTGGEVWFLFRHLRHLQFQFPGDCDRQPEWQSFGMLIFVTGCSHKP